MTYHADGQVAKLHEIVVWSAGRPFAESVEAADGTFSVVPTPLGLVVGEHVDKIGYFERAVEVVEKEILPDRLRFTLRLSDEATKPVSEIVRGFKVGCFRIAREYGLVSKEDDLPIFAPNDQHISPPKQ